MELYLSETHSNAEELPNRLAKDEIGRRDLVFLISDQKVRSSCQGMEMDSLVEMN